jgi:glutamine amidotransferase
MIVIIDYGLGNLGSIANMLNYLDIENIISSDPKEILKADKLILPGVGSFDEGMKNLKDRNLIPILNEAVLSRKKPLLGICLGMQLLGKSSEEGIEQGLGFIDFSNKKFDFGIQQSIYKIPHMGWTNICVNKSSPLAHNLNDDFRFYFVHTYYALCKNEDDILFKSTYGFQFTSGVQNNNIYGVQFHPEKSRAFGMKLLSNFASKC